MIAHRLSRLSCRAISAASHTDPSTDSPSPISTYTRAVDRSSRLAASAMPTPAGSPCPNEPVATSTNGRRGVGWPSRSDPNVRNLRSSALSNSPASAHAAYKSGAAWPLDSTKRSLPGRRGSVGSYRMTEKNNVATISAAEQQLDGWPLPASLVARTLSILSTAALWRNMAAGAEVWVLIGPIASPYAGERNASTVDGREVGESVSKTIRASQFSDGHWLTDGVASPIRIGCDCG